VKPYTRSGIPKYPDAIRTLSESHFQQHPTWNLKIFAKFIPSIPRKTDNHLGQDCELETDDVNYTDRISVLELLHRSSLLDSSLKWTVTISIVALSVLLDYVKAIDIQTVTRTKYSWKRMCEN
jgi:hypothetical protein